MKFTGTRILYPKASKDVRTHVPETAILAGTAFDVDDSCFLTYDRTTGTLFWLVKGACEVVRSCAAPLPNDNYLLDFCVFENTLYTLVYTEEGHLSICTGSLQQGKDEGLIDFQIYPLPHEIPSLPSGQSVWAYTHSVTPLYLHYHPKYCGITNVGHELFVLLGVCDDVVSPNPINLGQYIVNYDLLGGFNKVYKVDNSISGEDRPLARDMARLNGRAVGIAYANSLFTLLVPNNPPERAGVAKHIQLKGDSAFSIIGMQPYAVGPFYDNSSITIAGRFFYSNINNRLCCSDISVFDFQEMFMETALTSSIDIGHVLQGEVATRRISIKNISYFITYAKIILAPKTLNLKVSLDTDPPEFLEQIRLPVELAPGESTMFLLQFSAETFPKPEFFTVFHDYLSIRAESRW